MTVTPQLISIKARKMGLLLMNARQVARRSAEECAAVLGVPPDAYLALETGAMPPTLPQLELLAYYLNVPIEQFWASQKLSDDHPELADTQKVQTLRQKMIGTKLKLIRTQRKISLEEMSSRSGVSQEELTAYEQGDQPLPLPILEVLANILDKPIEEFLDERGMVGVWRTKQEASVQFAELPVEIQTFVCNPINRPYLNLAIRLSGLSVDRLRLVAEGLLEITY